MREGQSCMWCSTERMDRLYLGHITDEHGEGWVYRMVSSSAMQPIALWVSVLVCVDVCDCGFGVEYHSGWFK